MTQNLLHHRFQKGHQSITRFWWKENRHAWPYLLLPIAFLYTLFSILRRFVYRAGWIRSRYFRVPVVVVGNLTVGGTGKTPLVIHLATWLSEKGYHPGIVSRGYGAKGVIEPREVHANDVALEVGDEPLLMKRNVDCPVVICPRRVNAVQYLLAHYPDCDVVISDDGLQHYAMGRDIEILVVDGVRRFGNGFCLPVGPLREPVYRLKEMDLTVCQGGSPQKNEYAMELLPDKIVSLVHPEEQAERRVFSRAIIHAVAGIGNPSRFFETLRKMGLRFFEHAFPDHYFFTEKDLDFGENTMVVMTEKDAVKCTSFATDHHWFLKVTAKIDPRFEEALLNLLKQRRKGLRI